MHVDGFRFDLATTLGRVGARRVQPARADLPDHRAGSGAVAGEADRRAVGRRPRRLPGRATSRRRSREWNGKFRDALRRYWKGDENLASEVGYRLAGSADLFQGERRQPQASINFITAHDGFTLHDLVSYGSKHNEANGERNQDGADDNQSWNHGVEGETDDPAIIALRERQKRNLLATLFLVAGRARCCSGGDEMGRTQRGNNNAYCQDNELSWFDWNLDDRRRALLEFTRRLIALRRRHPDPAAAPLLRRRLHLGVAVKDLAWLRPDGAEMTPHDWQKPWISSLAFVLGGDAIPMIDERGQRLVDDGLLVLMNAAPRADAVQAAGGGGGRRLAARDRHRRAPTRPRDTPCAGDYVVAARALVVLRQPLDPTAARAAAGAPARVIKKEAQRRRRRAGVVIPLFSIRSAARLGAGRDPRPAARSPPGRAAPASRCCSSCRSTRVSDVDPSPYAASSAFALDPVYLSLDACEDFAAAGGREALPDGARAGASTRLKRSAVVDWRRVRALKRAGIALAFERFLRDEWRRQIAARAAAVRVHARQPRRGWTTTRCSPCCTPSSGAAGSTGRPGCAIAIRARSPRPGATHGDALLRRRSGCSGSSTCSGAARAARPALAGVELMGDLPFVVGLDSADVWANRTLFQLDRRLGAPPDDAFPEGQDWGLPVYDWPAMARDDFSWIRARATRAGELFSLLPRRPRARLLPDVLPLAGRQGRAASRPADEWDQIQLGEKLMRIMSRFGEVVAEDLGALPPFLRPSLERVGVPGYRVLRWERDGERLPRSGRLAGARRSRPTRTHDTDTTAVWYDELVAGRARAAAPAAGAGAASIRRGRSTTARAICCSRALYAAPSTLALIPFQDAHGDPRADQRAGHRQRDELALSRRPRHRRSVGRSRGHRAPAEAGRRGGPPVALVSHQLPVTSRESPSPPSRGPLVQHPLNQVGCGRGAAAGVLPPATARPRAAIRRAPSRSAGAPLPARRPGHRGVMPPRKLRPRAPRSTPAGARRCLRKLSST